MNCPITTAKWLGTLGTVISVSFLLLGCSDKAQQRIISLQADLDKSAERAKTYETDNQAIKSELNKVTEKLKSLETELKDRAGRVSSLEEQLKGNLAREHSTTERLSLLQKENQDMLRKLVTAEAIVAHFEAQTAKAAKETAEAASRSNLTVQLGLTMKSGDTKPITNAKVYLTKTHLLTLLPQDYKYEDLPALTAAGAWAKGLGSASRLYGKFVQSIVEAVEATAAFSTSTDFNGRASFEGIPPAEYLVLCHTSLGGGAVLEGAVTVKGKSALLALGNADILPEYRR